MISIIIGALNFLFTSLVIYPRFALGVTTPKDTHCQVDIGKQIVQTRLNFVQKPNTLIHRLLYTKYQINHRLGL